MPVAGKPVEPPHQWNQAPVTVIYQWKNKRREGKRIIQRLNEERGWQETLYKAHGDDPNLTALKPLH